MTEQQNDESLLSHARRVDYAVMTLGLYSFGMPPDWDPDVSIPYAKTKEIHDKNLKRHMDELGVPTRRDDPRWIEHENRFSKIVAQSTPQAEDLGVPTDLREQLAKETDKEFRARLERQEEIESKYPVILREGDNVPIRGLFSTPLFHDKTKNSSLSGCHARVKDDRFEAAMKETDEEVAARLALVRGLEKQANHGFSGKHAPTDPQLLPKQQNSSISGAHMTPVSDLPPVTEKDLDDQKGIFESVNPVEPPMALEMRLEVAKQIAKLDVEVATEKPLEEMTLEEKEAHNAAIYKKLDELGVPVYRSEIYQYGLRQHLENQPNLEVGSNIFDLIRGSSRQGQVLARMSKHSRKKKRK